jgi:hypothetical protein
MKRPAPTNWIENYSRKIPERVMWKKEGSGQLPKKHLSVKNRIVWKDKIIQERTIAYWIFWIWIHDTQKFDRKWLRYNTIWVFHWCSFCHLSPHLTLNCVFQEQRNSFHPDNSLMQWTRNRIASICEQIEVSWMQGFGNYSKMQSQSKQPKIV